MKTYTEFPHELLESGEEHAVKVTYTPEMAKEILRDRNSKNPRKLPYSRVDGIASSIQMGRFHFCGLGITFATDGQLADGQTRLNAVVASGVPTTMLTVFGAKPEVRYDIDTLSTPRHPADNLVVRLRDLQMNVNLAKAKIFNSAIKSAVSFVFGVTRKLSQAEIDALAERYKAAGALNFLNRNFSKSRRSKSHIQPVYGALFMAWPVDRKGVQKFTTELDSISRRLPNTTLPPEGSPILALSNYIEIGEYVFRRDNSSMRTYKTVVAIERALAGKTLTVLNGKVSEKFLTDMYDAHVGILGVKMVAQLTKKSSLEMGASI